MRNIKNINENWVFVKEKEKSTVNLPHTWNGIDGQDGGNDYYRGKCTYIKEIAKVDMPQGEEIYLQLDGVNSSAFVYFNSKLVCTHHGGYSTFRVKLENIKDNNEIKIEADNSPNDFVYPQQADFTFYGGIYRDVTLIGVEKNHFDLDFFGAPGIQITPIVNGDKADVNVKTYITGGGEVRVTVNGETKTGTEVDFTVDNPHLWNGVADPYLYNAVAELIVDGKVVDRVESRFGIRSFKVDPQKGFILNGKPYPLRGVSRHQDRPGIGNALLPEHHREDIELICEMGANTIRLAHYQHAQYFYDLCDEKGLVVWAEIPYISSHLEKGVENTKTQMTELIAQNYNHPCIVTWGLSNEITMSGASPAVVENHKMLNDLVHSMDKTRPTTEAVVTMCSMDNEYVHISDIVSYNHYFGWYGGNVNMYGPWFDKFHEKYPNKAIGISEYGCEALNWHATDIAQGDYTEEYQAYYHEELIKQIAVRPYLWATHVWNMFDFAADARAEGGENGMNHKGLVTFDRKYKKDSFYAYQAWLSDKPMLHICSKRYIDRVEDKVKIKVYSNQDEVELFANGESVGVQKKGEFPFFTFEVKNEGETVLTAKAGDLTDESKIRKVDFFNEDYRMKEEGTVINWFEINTPVGYYSVNDTIGDIMGSFRGKLAMLKIGAMLLKALKGDSQPSDEPKKKKSKGASIMGFKPSKEMLQLGYGFTVKRVISMLGGKFTKEQILKINAILNKVKKPKK
ncbi:glycoside hydrolase family 2 TIM barrel-domain containing protein [Eubacterium sp.]|uniref:glycoside hydrolase family 2 protein n=1 Tax=Eubacterium sp. TaxID=142586 RepID=UPI0026059F9F|nr:glycoside hydrolase family 2 TIM barrel-domain containing protein [Eubacterium sp.]MDD7331776.1 glycoside hydrolase family 2 TIM barrel-domain containing protein [Eubacterium sp.]